MFEHHKGKHGNTITNNLGEASKNRGQAKEGLTIKGMTYNCKGTKDRSKRIEIETFMKEEGPARAGMQETFQSQNNTERRDPWYGMSVATKQMKNKKQGIGSILPKKLLPIVKTNEPINERSMAITFNTTITTFIVAYAPIADKDDETKAAFYEQIEQTIRKHIKENLNIIGDWNVELENMRITEETIMGTKMRELGNMVIEQNDDKEDNCKRLIELCTTSELRIGNIDFQKQQQPKCKHKRWEEQMGPPWNSDKYI